jgi:hypothetical protein
MLKRLAIGHTAQSAGFRRFAGGIFKNMRALLPLIRSGNCIGSLGFRRSLLIGVIQSIRSGYGIGRPFGFLCRIIKIATVKHRTYKNYQKQDK